MRILLILLLMCNIAFADGLNARTSYTDYTQDANCVGAWRFNQDTADTAIDTSGNDLHGAVSGATYVTTGKDGNCWSFDGNDRIEMGVDAQFDPANLTFMYWVKTTDESRNLNGGSARGDIFGAGTGYSYRIDFHAGNTQLHITNTSNSPVGDIISIGDNNWHHWAITYDGTNFTAYRDGVGETPQAASAIDYTKTINSFTVGAQDNGAFGLIGLIDEVAIFSRALSADEVMDIYTNGIK